MFYMNLYLVMLIWCIHLNVCLYVGMEQRSSGNLIKVAANSRPRWNPADVNVFPQKRRWSVLHDAGNNVCLFTLRLFL